MGKSSGKSKRSVIQIYEKSPEIELLREQFPPRANLQASITICDQKSGHRPVTPSLFEY
jgi:hypothetical protein